MIVWYIHGAGASKRSFTWFHQQLEFPARFIDYQPDEPVRSVAQRLGDLIIADGQPTMLVGHSLGGIVAAVCAKLDQVARVATICAPFGGVRHAGFLSLFSNHPLFSDLQVYGPLLTGLRNTGLNKPHLAIVGSKGLPFLSEENDGVVSVASQMALPGSRYEMVPLNHFEVLLSDEVAAQVRKFAGEQG